MGSSFSHVVSSASVGIALVVVFGTLAIIGAETNRRWLLAIAAVGVVISIYYYFGWIKAAFFETWTPPVDDKANLANQRPARTPVSFVAGLALGSLAIASVVLGFYQGLLGQWLTMR